MFPRLLPFLVLLPIAAPAIGAAPDFARDIRPALESFCLDCHDDSRKPKGDLNLERFTDEAAVMEDRAVWKSVFDQLEAHMMPPPKRDEQPTAEQRAQLLAWVKDVLAKPDPALGARDPGKPVLRRLSRLEYNNTVRDLFALTDDIFLFPERQPVNKSYFQPATGRMPEQVDVRVLEYGAKRPVLLPQSGLPGDGRAEHGYGNRGDVMNLSPLLLEKYVAVAGEIVNSSKLAGAPAFQALVGDPAEARPVAEKVAVKAAFEAKAVRDFAPNRNLKSTAADASTALYQFTRGLQEGFDEGTAGVFAAEGNTSIPARQLIAVQFGQNFAKSLLLTPDHDVWLAAFVTADETSGSGLLTNKLKGTRRFAFDLAVAGGAPGEGVIELGLAVLSRNQATGPVTITAHYTGGGKLVATEDIGEHAGTDNTFFAFHAPAGQNITRLEVDGSRFTGDYVLIDDLGFRTATQGVPPAAVEPATKSAATSIDQRAVARERLGAFLPRAFRRAVDATEVERFAQLFDAASASGQSFSGAMKSALQAALASPSFLYLSERARPAADKVRPLDDYELASRLSYFLWATTPDDELLALAKAGTLHQPDVLAEQTRRMLRDPKVRELSESFGVQWLRLDQLYTSKPDAKLFPAFYAGPQGKDTAHGAMLVEALLLFETILIEDRSVLEFLDPGWSYLNPRMKKLYGLPLPEMPAPPPDATQETMRELKKKEEDAGNRWTRTALPDQTRGGVMHMGATLTLTSLPFRTSPVKRGAWLLETIFNRPPIEPKIAFILKDDKAEIDHAMSVRQRFEAHRSKAECMSCHIRLDPPGFALEAFSPIGTVREKDGNAPVDARGEWNGRAFNGPAEFKVAVMAKPDEFVRGFIEHLLSYALGRKLEYFDMATVDEIQQAAARDGYRFGSVIAEVVKSYPFRNVGNEVATVAAK